MEAEMSAEVGAELGEVAPELRVAHRSGYPRRAWETSAGELLIPRKYQILAAPGVEGPPINQEQQTTTAGDPDPNSA
jgi:hypothetical protein